MEFNKTSKYWTSRFPGELPDTPVVPEVLNSDEILVDGQVVNLIHVGQGDVEGSTIFHVPSADAVVCGDVVYNNVHMMMYEADEAKREAWIASIDAVAALNPKIVVAGHKSVGAADLPENLAAASSTCATSPPSRRRAARWRTWSAACSSCMASATSRTPYGSRPEPKSLAERNHSDRAASPYGLTIRPALPRRTGAAWRNCPIASVGGVIPPIRSWSRASSPSRPKAGDTRVSAGVSHVHLAPSAATLSRR